MFNGRYILEPKNSVRRCGVHEFRFSPETRVSVQYNILDIGDSVMDSAMVFEWEFEFDSEFGELRAPLSRLGGSEFPTVLVTSLGEEVLLEKPYADVYNGVPVAWNLRAKREPSFTVVFYDDSDDDVI